MDKKNTMLLTVIAVATLLVAVVGATFAYFAVATERSEQTIKVTGEATAVGAATLETPVTAMKINLTGTQMAEDAQGTSYYSTTATDKAYETTAVPATIARVGITGGDDTVSYTCNYALTIAKGATDTMIENLVAGDGSIVLAGATLTDANTTFDLTELKNDAEGNAQTITVNGSATALTNAAPEEVTAYVQINNTTAKQTFAGTNLAVEITATTFTCEINK